MRILIVDDHPIVRDGLSGILGREPDLEVVAEAADGDEAIAQVARCGPDVVLMDLRMPGRDGLSAIRALRASDPMCQILVLTTYDTDRDILAAIDAGAQGYILKDAPREDLIRAVRDVAAGRTVLPSRALQAIAARHTDTDLTGRELDVLRLVAGGGTNKSVGRALMVSEATVKTHLAHAYDKLGVSDRAAAVRVAYERGLL